MRMGEEFGWKGGTEQNFDQKNKNESEKQCKIYNFFICSIISGKY